MAGLNNMGVWEGLDGHIQILITLGAGVTALGLLYSAVKWMWKFGRDKIEHVSWLFTERHDHAKIFLALDDIKLQLINNGGTSLKDSIDRVELNQEFQLAYMRTSQHASDKAIFETNSKGEVVYVNLAYMRLTGFSNTEVMNMGWVNSIAPSERDHVVRKWLKAVASQRNFDEYITLMRPDGEEYKAHARAYVIPSISGEVLGHFGEVLPL